MSASAPTEPRKATALVDALASAYAAFAADGPTEDELAVAKKQAAVLFQEQVKDPAYWLARTSLMTFRGVRLDDVAADPAAYQALTAKQVKDAFAAYYAPRNTIVVVVSPVAGDAAAKAAGGMGPAPGK